MAGGFARFDPLQAAPKGVRAPRTAKGRSGGQNIMITPPNYSGQPLGFDCSHHDGVIDWSVIDTSVIKFAAVKVSEGASFVDPQFKANWDGAERIGIRRLAYLYLNPTDDTLDQTNLFRDQLAEHPWQDGDRAVLDIEGPSWSILGPGQRAQKLINASAQIKAATGRNPILYYSPGWFAGLFDAPAFADWDHWLARYGVDSPGQDCLIWQYSDAGSVHGVGDGDVDLDVWLGGWE